MGGERASAVSGRQLKVPDPPGCWDKLLSLASLGDRDCRGYSSERTGVSPAVATQLTLRMPKAGHRKLWSPQPGGSTCSLPGHLFPGAAGSRPETAAQLDTAFLDR